MSGEQIILFSIVFYFLTVLVNSIFAFAVYFDAKDLSQNNPKGTFFVGAVIWALATLLGGVFVAGLYWVIHHSTLNPNRNYEEKRDNL